MNNYNWDVKIPLLIHGKNKSLAITFYLYDIYLYFDEYKGMLNFLFPKDARTYVTHPFPGNIEPLLIFKTTTNSLGLHDPSDFYNQTLKHEL